MIHAMTLRLNTKAASVFAKLCGLASNNMDGQNIITILKIKSPF